MKSYFNGQKGKVEVDVLQTKSPKVFISDECMVKMMCYIDSCDDEIGWLGTAYKKNDKFYIDDVMLFEQDVHGTTTEITPEGLEEFGSKLLEEENGLETWNKIRVWGHSHVNMSVSASGQDDDQMETFSSNGLDWFIRIIANKKGEMQVDVYNFESGIIYKNVKYYHLLNEEEYELTKEIDKLEKQLEKLKKEKNKVYKEVIEKEVKEKVRKISYGKYKNNIKVINKSDYTDYGYGYGYGSGYQYNSFDKENDEDGLYEDIVDIIDMLDDRDVEELYYMQTFTHVQEYINSMFNYNIDSDDFDNLMNYVESIIDKVLNTEVKGGNK